jgi:hypothetical protein
MDALECRVLTLCSLTHVAIKYILYTHIKFNL